MKKIFTIMAITGMLFSASMMAQDFPSDPGSLVIDLELVAIDSETGDSIPGQAPDGSGPYNAGQQVTITAKNIAGYTFLQWSDQETANTRTITLNESMSLSAMYSHDKYAIKFIDADGSTLQEFEQYFGDTLITDEIKPFHEATAQYTYEFTGWNPAVANVTGPQNYYAVYDTITNKYAVNFYDWDETLLESDTLEYGQPVVFNGATPTRNAVDGIQYTFSGWEPTLASIVTENLNYTAQYSEEQIEYTITININGGTEPITQTIGANYNGEVSLSVTGIPNDYHFISWSDGSTEYPRTIVVTQDSTFVGTIGPSYVDVSVEANKWTFFCLPMTAEGGDWNSEMFVQDGLSQVAWGTYNSELRAASQSGWETPEEYNALKGYIIWSASAGRLRLNVYPENLNQSIISINLQEYEAAYEQNANWNFIGNPLYTEVAGSSIVFEGKGEATATVWNGTGYDNEILTSQTFALQPLQAFFIQIDSTSRVTFTGPNGAPARRNAPAVETPENSRIDIYATAGGYTDKTRVIFRSNSSIKYEAGRDASKFITKTAPIQMYMLDVDNIECAQMVRPTGNDNMRIGYMLREAGDIEISMPIYAEDYELYDALTGRSYDLNDTFTIYSEAGTYENRLELRPIHRVPTDITSTSVESITMKVLMNGQLYILRDGKLFSIEGQEVK